MQRGHIHIGVSGWRYEGWRGVFYPDDLRQRDELAYLSRQFPTVEINGSFYALQTPKSYQAWYDATPENFIFSVKGGRYITHIRRLKEVEKPLANFFASGVLKLGEKLGPFLWQLPPNFRYDKARIENFLKQLPHTGSDAIRLARRHDAKVEGRSHIPRQFKGSMRHCLEVRHDSFKNDEFIKMLRQYNIALVFSDSPGNWPYFEDLTGDFVYMRLHGHSKLYSSGYSTRLLHKFADRIDLWAQGQQVPDAKIVSAKAAKKIKRDIYVYLDNDAKVKAPEDAVKLTSMLGIAPQSTLIKAG